MKKPINKATQINEEDTNKIIRVHNTTTIIIGFLILISGFALCLFFNNLLNHLTANLEVMTSNDKAIAIILILIEAVTGISGTILAGRYVFINRIEVKQND